MKFFSKSQPAPVAEPQVKSPATLIRPLRPFACDQQTPSLPWQAPRNPVRPSATALARDPRAHPAAPARLNRAVQRTYVLDPED